ncbi:MAG TPA: thioesterase family protein [Gammaproteobacteria bacterium]|nr:thioesterase family protein [Gammaproteobacteria bacterium]
MKSYDENEYLRWESEVRNYEIDYQGIVGNAIYFNYLDEARAKYLQQLDVSVVKYALENKNIVLVKTDINFKRSLRYGDSFCVLSKLSRISRFKFLFDQTIILKSSDQIMVTAESVIACVNREGKPCAIDQFEHMPFN